MMICNRVALGDGFLMENLDMVGSSERRFGLRAAMTIPRHHACALFFLSSRRRNEVFLYITFNFLSKQVPKCLPSVECLRMCFPHVLTRQVYCECCLVYYPINKSLRCYLQCLDMPLMLECTTFGESGDSPESRLSSD